METLDDLWQQLLDEECARWSARSADELKALPQFARHKVRSGTDEVEYALWHESPVGGSDAELHSFVFQAQRKSGIIYQRNYLAGFALDENDAVVSVAEDVILHYD